MTRMIHSLAVEDAQDGDEEARQWLESNLCRGLLWWFIPIEADVEAVQQALIDMADEPARLRRERNLVHDA
jgi:hypothetical protein